jgi:hypothetical protein
MVFLTTQSENHAKEIALCLNSRCWTGFFGILQNEHSIADLCSLRAQAVEELPISAERHSVGAARRRSRQLRRRD